MSQPNDPPRMRGSMTAILVGVVGGVILLALAASDLEIGGPRVDRSGRLSIHINGVPQRMARDVFLPVSNWVLQLRYADLPVATLRDNLVVRLRSERTGGSIEIQDRFSVQDDFATLTIPKDFRLGTGLISVRATFTDAAGRQFEDTRRIRIRSQLGGLPIGIRQVIHFDFSVDHDEDGTPDFWKDLERFGLTSGSDPAITKLVADRIEALALARVEAAYDDPNDPNRTGEARDVVTVLFRPNPHPGALTTRICVGGTDPTESDLVGHVRFDYRNADKTSTECSASPAAGLFPAELDTYRDAALYRETFDGLIAERGGQPIGDHPDDSLETIEAVVKMASETEASLRRQRVIHRALTVFSNALGSIMAHEAGHALGLVPSGRPSVGLFGGDEASGALYAHNLDALGEPESTPWLMNAGGSLEFEELAGESENGPLRFRPLNYAYLRDRIVVTDER